MNISEERGRKSWGENSRHLRFFHIFGCFCTAQQNPPNTCREERAKRKRGKKDSCRLKNSLKRLTDLVHHHFLLIWPEGMANKGEEKPRGIWLLRLRREGGMGNRRRPKAREENPLGWMDEFDTLICRRKSGAFRPGASTADNCPGSKAIHLASSMIWADRRVMMKVKRTKKQQTGEHRLDDLFPTTNPPQSPLGRRGRIEEISGKRELNWVEWGKKHKKNKIIDRQRTYASLTWWKTVWIQQ